MKKWDIFLKPPLSASPSEDPSVRRIGLRIAYDGTAYHGWQMQQGIPTIEGELIRALEMLLPEERPLPIGASRTDAGVHALGNVAVFDTGSRIPAGNFTMALNRYLPSDIRVMEAMELPDGFHPRFTPHRKIYAYHVDNSRIPNPMHRLYSYHFPFELDVERMQAAADCLVGEHDFTSFANPDSQVLVHGGDAVRTIWRLEAGWEDRTAGRLRVLAEGNGFLYNMIRIIVGTLLLAGRGRLSPLDMQDILLARDRTKAGPTVPARGLCLVRLDYQEI